MLADRVAQPEVDPEVAQRVERRRHRERVAELVLSARQILQHGEIVARARFDRARDPARLLERGHLDVDVDAIGDVRRLLLPCVEGGVRDRAELGVGRQHGRARRVAEGVMIMGSRFVTAPPGL